MVALYYVLESSFFYRQKTQEQKVFFWLQIVHHWLNIK